MTDPAPTPRHAQQRALTRSDFPVLWPLTTRWSDNDMYGHLNNATYFQLFDTAINGWLASVTGADPVGARVIGVVAESSCVYFGEVGFPQQVTIGLRVAHLGRTSVGYELGVFAEGIARIAAFGRWTHVYVDRASRVPSAPSPAHREAFEGARTSAPVNAGDSDIAGPSQVAGHGRAAAATGALR